MSQDSEAPELYRRYRPTNFKQVVGQDTVIRSLAAMGKAGKIPHFILFSGPSGCGKTTIARILRKKLCCGDADFVEINASEDRGIDMIREMKKRMHLAPVSGKTRIWLVDECHALTGDAQNAVLKILEDTPRHVYIIFATTDPQKLKKTIRTRGQEFKCEAILPGVLNDLVMKVSKEERVELSGKVAKAIVRVADGSARKALVILHAVVGASGEEEQLATVESNDVESEAIEIARKLLKSSTDWKDIAETLSKLKDDAESVRHLVLAYSKSVLLKSGNPRAAVIMEEFRDNFYDSKVPGLVLACYNVVKGR